MFDKTWVRLTTSIVSSVIYAVIGFLVAAKTSVDGMIYVAYSMLAIGVFNVIWHLLTDIELEMIPDQVRAIAFYVSIVIANAVLLWLNSIYAKVMVVSDVWLKVYVMSSFIMGIALPYFHYMAAAHEWHESMAPLAIFITFPVVICLMRAVIWLGAKVAFLRTNGMIAVYLVLWGAFLLHASIEGFGAVVGRDFSYERDLASYSSDEGGYESSGYESSVSGGDITSYMDNWCWSHSRKVEIDDLCSVHVYADRRYTYSMDTDFDGDPVIYLNCSVYYSLCNYIGASNEITHEQERRYNEVMSRDYNAYDSVFSELREDLGYSFGAVTLRTNISSSEQNDVWVD